jgi:hypothetical protein
MITYNFENYRVGVDNTIEGIYWNIRDSDHPEENFQIGHYTELALEEEITPEEAIALVKSTIGAEEIANIESQFPLQPFMIEKLAREAEEANQILAAEILERDGDPTIEI